MFNAFITGFTDELVKQAAHPLFQTVARGGTMLGQKVRAATARTAKKSEKIGNRASRGAGLKGVVEKTSAAKLAFFESEDDEESGEGEGGEADDAGEMLRRMMAQYQQDSGYSEEPDAGADAPLYGGGEGLAFMGGTAKKQRGPAVAARRSPHNPRGRSPHMPPPTPPKPKPKKPTGPPMGGLAPPERQTRPPKPPAPKPRQLPTDLE